MAQGGVAQARLRKNPTLMLGGLKEIGGADTRFSIGGTIPLELFGRRATRTETAERRLDSVRDTVADRERLLASAVRLRFGEALAAVRKLTFAEEILLANRNALKLTEDRVREGATPALEAEELRVEVNRIASMRTAYQGEAEVTLLMLKEAVGLQPEEPVRLKGSLEIIPRTLDQNQLLQLALSHRPDLAAQIANEAAATADLGQQQAEAKPDAALSFSYEHPSSGFAQRALDPAGNFSPIRQTFNYAVFGLEINLPAFNRNQGVIAAGRAAILSAHSQTSAVDLALRHEVARNLIRFNTAQARAAIYRTGVRDGAARNLEVVRKTHEYGRSSFLDVIAEQRRFIEIETAYTDVLLEAYTAQLLLEQSVGTALP